MKEEIIEQPLEVVESAGAMRQQQNMDITPGRPEGIKEQSWEGWYCPWKEQPIHRVIEDMFTGQGGCKGAIDPGLNNPTMNGNNSDGYSFLDPYSTELQWRTRVTHSFYTNLFGRYVYSQVNPILGDEDFKILVYKGKSEVPLEDDDFIDWTYNCTMTGTTYRAIQQYAAHQWVAHDVVYLIMTAVGGEPALSVRIATDFLESKSDDVTGELVSIMFWNGIRKDGNKVYAKAIRYFMDGEYCKIELLEGDYSSGDKDDIEWVSMEIRNTEVKEMICYPMMVGARPFGEWLPQNPSSFRMMSSCMALFQSSSKVQWLFTLLCLPIPFVYSEGEISGIKAGGSQLFLITGGGVNGWPPNPGFMQVESSSLNTAIEYLNSIKNDISDIARENGVNTGSANSAQQQSGDSKRFDFLATEQKLKERVRECKTMNRWVFHMYNVYKNRDDSLYDYRITYPDTFYPEEPTTVQDYIDTINMLRELDLSESVAESVKHLVQPLLPNITEAQWNSIAKEVDTKVMAMSANEDE